MTFYWQYQITQCFIFYSQYQILEYNWELPIFDKYLNTTCSKNLSYTLFNRQFTHIFYQTQPYITLQQSQIQTELLLLLSCCCYSSTLTWASNSLILRNKPGIICLALGHIGGSNHLQNTHPPFYKVKCRISLKIFC